MMQALFLRTALLVLALLMGACAVIPPQAPAGMAYNPPAQPQFPAVFGPRPTLPSPEEVHRLSPAQEQAFFAYLNLPANAGLGLPERLYNFMASETAGFRYESTTYTASETLALNQGNCMSLAVLTTALAHLAGVDIQYQLIDSRPVFELEGTVAHREVHLRSLIFAPDAGEAQAVGAPRGIQIDYFPALRGRFIGNLTPAEYTAMYYSNIAAAAIGANDYNTAYWYSLEALAHEPGNPNTLNMLAVLYRRAGDFAKAEEIYRYGIAQAENKLLLLKNYHVLLRVQNRVDEARAIEQTLETMDDPSPIHWLNLANESHDGGAYTDAVRYFDRALDLAPYLHEAHLGKAQSLYHLGLMRSAEESLRLAIDQAQRASTRTLYEAKLRALTAN